jgi:hypothetical protein
MILVYQVARSLPGATPRPNARFLSLAASAAAYSTLQLVVWHAAASLRRTLPCAGAGAGPALALRCVGPGACGGASGGASATPAVGWRAV